MKKPGILFFLGIIFLDLYGVQGTPVIKNQRCSCISTSDRMIHLKSLKDLKQFDPSPACKKTEIIAIMKNGDQTCLNPDSEDVKELVKEWKKKINQMKKQKKGKKHQKNKKFQKAKKPQHSRQKKTA
ncbi:C-X-C motif chemokine 9 [Nannospalax galili]|uniref:C-X-C motif chemokine n=1 Tax=Nannospalax galili TaxID=1026970 RepID=A0A8C6QSQ9_NANGA|nr:C-X-C motif chemokine 9 [Nannospalax galili]